MGNSLIVPKAAKEAAEKQKADAFKNEQDKLIKEYNQDILDKNIEDYYKDGIEILHGNVLVKLFKIPYLNKSGLINHVTYQVPSPSGTKYLTQTDPHPYQNRGLIVNMDEKLGESAPYKVGDFVQISKGIVQTRLSDSGPEIHYMFKKYDEDDFKGYVLIPSREIVCILKEYE